MDDPVTRARERYGQRCGYCSVHEHAAGALLTLDHHRPRTRGGDDGDDNLVYCCPKCNEHKGAYWHETDPPYIRLLHPLRDSLALHIAEAEVGRLLGLTPEGAFLVERLRLNRPPLVAYRLHRRRQQQLQAEVDTLRGSMRALQEQVAALDAALEALARRIGDEAAGE